MMNMDFLTIADFLAEFEFASNCHFPLKSLSTHPEPQDGDRSKVVTNMYVDKNDLHKVIPLSRVSSSSELT